MSPSRPHVRVERANSQAGFTLAELVVACVLAAVVIGFIGTIIMKSLSGSQDAAATVRSNVTAAEAAERFGADVRAARAHGRDGSMVIDRISLRSAIQGDTDIADHDGTLIDWRDIAAAGPSNLVLQADVIDEPGASRPECIEWRVEGTATWHVRRIVRPYSPRCAGGGGALEDDRITAPTNARPRPGTSGTAALFEYAVAQRVAAGGCTTSATSSPTNVQRNRIVGARIDFASLDTYREQSSQTTSHEVVALRSRSGSEYQTAMECDG